MRFLWLVALCLIWPLMGCQGPGAHAPQHELSEPVCVQYHLGGRVTNHFAGANPYVTLDDGAYQLTVKGSEIFTFPEAYCPGTRFSVRIVAQSAGSTCVMQNNTGVLTSAPVTDIAVICDTSHTASYTFTPGDAASYSYNPGPSSVGTMLQYGSNEIALPSTYQVDNASTFGAGTYTNTVLDPGTGVVRLTMQASGVPLLIYAGSESNDPLPFMNTTADPAMGTSNVGAFCCGLPGMESAVHYPENGVSPKGGSGQYVYSGYANGTSPTYANNKLLALGAYHLRIADHSYLEYWIFPESSAAIGQITDPLSLYVTLNVVFSDGTDAISLGATDQYGRSIDPPAHQASLSLDTWNRVVIDLSALVGKQVDRIDFTFHNDGANGYFRGFFDEINLVGVTTNLPTNTAGLDPSWTPQYNHLMGYWSFDGTGPVASGTVLTGSVGASIVAQNVDGFGMTHVNGQVGQGVLLDGVDDYFRLPDTFAATNTAYTFSAWHYYTGTPNACAALFAFIYASHSFYDLSEACGGYSFLSPHRADGDSPDLVLSPLPANAWNHVAATFSGTTATVYINGLVWGTSNTVTYSPADIPAIFRTLGLNSSAGALRGRLDEVAFWDVALSPNEVRVIYDRQRSAVSGAFTSRVFDATATNEPWTGIAWTTPMPFGKQLPNGTSETTSSYASVDPNLEDQLQLLWHLEETSLGTAPGGADCLDASGAGNHGIFVGTRGTNYDLAQPGIARDTNGVILYDRGSYTGFVVSTQAFTAYPTNFSYQVWFKSSTTAGGKIFGMGDGQMGSASYDKHVYMAGSGALLYGVYTGYVQVVQTPRVYNDGKWHHAAVSQQGTTGNFYVDGALVGSVSGAPQGYTYYIHVGCDNLGAWPNVADYCFFGEVDEVAFWTRNLSSAEILQLYRRGANRLGFQVRVCAQPDCSDSPVWQGPDGTPGMMFSEVENRNGASILTSSPNMLFTAYSNAGALAPAQYFQYRAFLDSDDTNGLCTYDATTLGCSAELSGVTIAPTHYSRLGPTFTATSPTPTFGYITHIAETYGSEGCAGRVGYRLSLDGTAWYYFAADKWQPSNGSVGQMSLSTNLSLANLAQFTTDVGSGQLHLQGALRSDGGHACGLSAIVVTYIP